MKIGQTLANRFVLIGAEGKFGDGIKRWEARDTRLDRPVTVVVYPAALADAAESAALAATLARDPRLARVSSLRIGDRVAVVIDRPAGVRLRDVTADRLLPIAVARAAVRATADALAATTLSAPGELLDVTVTATGKVVVAGAGLGDVGATAAPLGTQLALWLREATTREDAEPEGLTEAELALFADAAAGKALDAAAVLKAVPEQARDALRGVARDTYTYERRIAPVLPEPEPQEDLLDAGLGTAGVDVPTRPIDVDEWEFDEFLAAEAAEAEALPTVGEALLQFLHRRFPNSAGITRALARAHERTIRGPRFNASPLVMLVVVGFVAAMAYLSFVWFAEPFVPDYDIGRNPPQQYPEFTYPVVLPSLSPSP